MTRCVKCMSYLGGGGGGGVQVLSEKKPWKKLFVYFDFNSNDFVLFFLNE